MEGIHTARSLLLLSLLATAAVSLSACGSSNKLVKNAQFKTWQQDGDALGELVIDIDTGAVLMPTFDLPILNPNHPDEKYGQIGMRDLAGGGAEITIDVDITQVSHAPGLDGSRLPNGNLMIRGSQEVRVNAELRVLTIAGIVRPSDIGAENTISYERIAEARISYGGRGRVSEIQQPGYGQQVLDQVLPF